MIKTLQKSYKKVWIAVTILIIIGAFFLYLEFKNKGETYDSKFQQAVVTAVQKSLDEQMPNWEETLRQTSTSTAWQLPPNATVSGTANQPLTETDKFAQNFFQQYLALRSQNGGTDLSDSDKSNLITSMLEQAPFQAPTADYKISDLNVINDESIEAVKIYGNALGQTITKNSIPKSEHELTIFEKAFNDDSAKELDRLDPIIEKYKNVLNDLVKMPVPASAANTHLELVIAMDYMVKSTSGFKTIFTDPLKAMGYIRFYPQSVNTLSDAYKKLVSYFNSRKIVFDKSEQGWVLMNSL